MTTRTLIIILCTATICCTACKTKHHASEANNEIHLFNTTHRVSLSRYNVRLFDTIDVLPWQPYDDTATIPTVQYRAIRRARLDAIITDTNTMADTATMASRTTTQTQPIVQRGTFQDSQYKFFYLAVFIVVIAIFTIHRK